MVSAFFLVHTRQVTLTLRPVSRDEIRAFRHVIFRIFGGDVPSAEEEDDRYVAVLPPERTCAAFDGDEMVATSGTFGLSMSVPGGSMPIAGLTMVTVAPTHRRRGVLRKMIGAHLDGAAARGDALSALWASEAGIYGRFGYGMATELDRLSLATAGFEIAQRFGTDALITLEGEHRDSIIPAVYEAVRAPSPPESQRAGMLVRDEPWWTHRHFHDPPSKRAGASKLRYVVARRDGIDRGYLCYRQRPKFTDEAMPDGEVVIVELLAADERAEASLFRFATQIDLHPRVSWWNAPVDTILPWIGSNYRRVSRRRVDALWIRICDVCKALEGRTYGSDGQLCFALSDPMGRCDGTWVLKVESGRGRCKPSGNEPDIELTLAALGSLFFGGVSASTLNRVGRITGDPRAVIRADAMFATRLAPWCAEIF